MLFAAVLQWYVCLVSAVVVFVELGFVVELVIAIMPTGVLLVYWVVGVMVPRFLLLMLIFFCYFSHHGAMVWCVSFCLVSICDLAELI